MTNVEAFLASLEEDIGYIFNDIDGINKWHREVSPGSFEPVTYAYGYCQGMINSVIRHDIFTVDELREEIKAFEANHWTQFYEVIRDIVEDEREAISWRGYKKDLEERE